MPATAVPVAATAHPTPLIPTDSDVQWFGASQRLIGGQPDSRYGWLERGGEVLIVKAISADLSAYTGTLLEHERKMLKRLATLNAPVPKMIDVGRSDWLVTRFGGLSMQRLTQPAGLQDTAAIERLDFAERLAAWVYLLRRLQPVADAGVLAIDLYSANVVLPLTGTTQGQLRLHEAALIDHAHTLEAGSGMCRPVWIDHNMRRIAPELKDALKADMSVLQDAFAKAGATLPGYSRLPGSLDAHSRRVWAEYNQTQQLQTLLDQGSLSRDHAMQFAAGVAMKPLVLLANSPQQEQALGKVLQRMTAFEASQRYRTLTQAADALADVLGTLPLVSQHSYAPLQPSDLALPATPEPEPAGNEKTATQLANDIPPQPQPAEETARPAQPISNPPNSRWPMRWIYLAVLLGAVCGTLWPLGWAG